MNEAIKMQLSAFVDGELPENEAELLLRRLSQDVELRQQVAEFMAIGRAMRGEIQVTGIDTLRDRVNEALDAAPVIPDIAEGVPADNRMVRPMVGFAIAATVALVAIFGLRQMASVEGEVPQLADGEDQPSYTQQQPEDILDDELLREMRRMHDETASDQSIGTRLTSLGIEEELEELDSDEHEDEALNEPVSAEIIADDAKTE
jgi:negative regulator of sigma E activity